MTTTKLSSVHTHYCPTIYNNIIATIEDASCGMKYYGCRYKIIYDLKSTKWLTVLALTETCQSTGPVTLTAYIPEQHDNI